MINRLRQQYLFRFPLHHLLLEAHKEGIKAAWVKLLLPRQRQLLFSRQLNH